MSKILIAIRNIHYLLFKCKDWTQNKPRQLNTDQSFYMLYILYLLKTFSYNFPRQTKSKRQVMYQLNNQQRNPSNLNVLNVYCN